MNWQFDKVADALAAVFSRAEAQLRLEQAVYGLDAVKEKELQSLLARGLEDARYCDVAREVHYPSELALTRPNRRRCDLVLTPRGRPLLVAEEVDLFTSPRSCPA